jgi:hypothetical protein
MSYNGLHFLANSGDAWDGASGMVWKKLRLSTVLGCSRLKHHVHQGLLRKLYHQGHANDVQHLRRILRRSEATVAYVERCYRTRVTSCYLATLHPGSFAPGGVLWKLLHQGVLHLGVLRKLYHQGHVNDVQHLQRIVRRSEATVAYVERCYRTRVTSCYLATLLPYLKVWSFLDWFLCLFVSWLSKM